MMMIVGFDCGFSDGCKNHSKVQSTVKTQNEADFVFDWMDKNDKVFIDIEHSIKRLTIPDFAVFEFRYSNHFIKKFIVAVDRCG